MSRQLNTLGGVVVKNLPFLKGVLPSTETDEKSVCEEDASGVDVLGGLENYPIFIEPQKQYKDGRCETKSITRTFVVKFTPNTDKSTIKSQPYILNISETNLSESILMRELFDRSSTSFKKVSLISMKAHGFFITPRFELKMKVIVTPRKMSQKSKSERTEVEINLNDKMNGREKPLQIYCLPKNISKNTAVYGCGKEHIISAYEINKVFESKEIKDRRGREFYPNHGGIKIHQDSFIGKWLYEKRFVSFKWNNKCRVIRYRLPMDGECGSSQNDRFFVLNKNIYPKMLNYLDEEVFGMFTYIGANSIVIKIESYGYPTFESLVVKKKTKDEEKKTDQKKADQKKADQKDGPKKKEKKESIIPEGECQITFTMDVCISRKTKDAFECIQKF